MTPFGQSKPPIYLGQAGRESLPARVPHRAGAGLTSGDRVNLLERYDYPRERDMLVTLIEDYENEHHGFGPVGPKPP